MYVKRKDNLDIRMIRKESMMNNKLSTHTFSWIYNWCIWKNYWQVKYKDFDKSDQLESQIKNYKEMITFNEYLHLKYSNATVKPDKIENVAKQTQLFSFFKYGKNYIDATQWIMSQYKQSTSILFTGTKTLIITIIKNQKIK